MIIDSKKIRGKGSYRVSAQRQSQFDNVKLTLDAQSPKGRNIKIHNFKTKKCRMT